MIKYDKDYICWDDILIDAVILKGSEINSYKGSLENIQLLSQYEINDYIDFLKLNIKYEYFKRLEIVVDTLYNEIKMYKYFSSSNKKEEYYYNRFQDIILDIKDPEVYENFINAIKNINSKYIKII